MSQTNEMKLSERITGIKPSPTLAISAKASELRAKGIDIISFSAGEPNFDTPNSIKNAAIEAIEDGYTKYTPVDGMVEMKKAVQQKFITDNDLHFELDEIIVSSGGKQVIFNAILATIDPGDEVIIPAPYWVSYPDIVALAGGKVVPVVCDARNDFKITAKQLEKAITTKTKWVILNSPNNPTGAVYSAQELKQIASVLLKHPHVQILSDDIYEKIIYDDTEFNNILQIEPKLKDRVLIVNGVSKTYAMTGWRIGYGAGNARLINAMKKIQSQSTSNPCSISQMASIEALTGPQNFVEPNCLGFKRKRDLLLSLLNNIPGLKCQEGQGAFYLFVDCSEIMGKQTPYEITIQNSADFATYLLESANVAIVPGSAFGVEGYFRISYATSEDIIAEGCKRILLACEKLREA